MDPFTIMSLFGMGANVLGNLFGGKEVMPQQINPLTDQYYQDVLRELAQYNAAQNRYAGEADSARSQVSGQAGMAEQLRDRQGQVNVPRADDWLDAFMEEHIPGYQQVAQQTADLATRGGAVAQAERAQALSEQAARNAAAQFAGSGGMFSGSMGKAVGEGAANPIADYEAKLGENYQNAFMNAYTPLQNTGQNLAYQGNQDEFQNTMNQLAQMLQSTQLAGNMYSNSMTGAQNMAQLYGERARGAEQWRNDVAQPFYATPNYKPNPLAVAGQGLSNLGMLGSAVMNNPFGVSNTNNPNPWDRNIMQNFTDGNFITGPIAPSGFQAGLGGVQWGEQYLNGGNNTWQ